MNAKRSQTNSVFSRVFSRHVIGWYGVALLFGSVAVVQLLHHNSHKKSSHTEDAATTLVAMVGQPVEVLDLSERTGFLGILVDISYEKEGILIRLKGLLPKEGCPRRLWRDVSQRNGVLVFDHPRFLWGRRKALVADCLLTADGEFAVGALPPNDPRRKDAFIGALSQISLHDLSLKLFVSRDTDGWSFTVVDEREFMEQVHQLEQSTKKFLQDPRPVREGDGADDVDPGV